MKVVIAFSPNLDEIGKTRDVPDGEAARLIAEGRARPATDPAPGKSTTSKTAAPASKPSE